MPKMGTPSVSGGGFDFFTTSTGGRWSWRVVANNIAGSSQFFYVTDITSPWGKLADVDQPVPGDVVAAISDSLSNFQDQLAPALEVTSQEAFTATVNEGDVPAVCGTATFVNSGAFGSFMNVTAASNAQWLTPSPASIKGIGKNQSGQVAGLVNPGVMLAASSPYIGVINLQDNRSTPTIAPIAFSINVLPRPTIELDRYEVGFTFNIASQTAGAPQTLELTNSGPDTSVLSVRVSKVQNRSPWLVVSPDALGPLAAGGTGTINLQLSAAGIVRIPGVYTETLTVTSQTATNAPVTVTVRLTVS